MYRPQPAGRAPEEIQWWYQHQWHRVIEATEPGADQSHIMVHRQPAHEHVGGIHFEHVTHGADVGEQVSMRKHHTFWVGSTA